MKVFFGALHIPLLAFSSSLFFSFFWVVLTLITKGDRETCNRSWVSFDFSVFQNKARRKKLCIAATGLIVLIILIAIIASAAKNWELHDSRKFVYFCLFNLPCFIVVTMAQMWCDNSISFFQNRSRQKILYLASLAALALFILIFIVWARW